MTGHGYALHRRVRDEESAGAENYGLEPGQRDQQFGFWVIAQDGVPPPPGVARLPLYCSFRRSAGVCQFLPGMYSWGTGSGGPAPRMPGLGVLP